MGDPRKLKRSYEPPKKILDMERIEEEGKLVKEYGLRNTRELWIMLAHLKRVRREARKLLAMGERGEEEGKKIISKLRRLGIGKDDMKLEDLLALSVRDFLERRLQTRVVKKGLARTQRQGRQLITHGFISVRGRKASAPSYLVSAEEDQTISYYKGINIEPPEPAPKGHGKEAAPAAPEAPKASE